MRLPALVLLVVLGGLFPAGGLRASLVGKPKVQPRVKITATRQLSSSGYNTLLICDVTKFFPFKIEIKWLKNGKELEDPIWSTDLIQNVDWTFQIQAMLVTQPEHGDVYACWVDRATFKKPITVHWEAHSSMARSKMWTGIMGVILGSVFVTAGLTLYLHSKKGLIS
uniref:Ig-like domain-containing protein n=1 Tax=Salvator merianae TaxID=96440 RepID=A0A8D0DZU2_SALMN